MSADSLLVPVVGGEVEVLVAGEGAPVIATHPFMWADADHPLIAAIAAVARAFMVNPRGTGRSSEPRHDADLSRAQLVADLDAVRTHFGIDRWVVLGQSGGGPIALQYALTYPQALRGLALTCTTAGRPGPESVYHPENPDYGAASEALASGDRATLNGLIAHRPELLDDNPHGGTSAERSAAFARDAGKIDLRSRLAEIDAPTLVAGGVSDRAIPLVHQQELAAVIRDSELVVFEESGHFPYAEEPVKFAQVLGDFLERISSG